MSGKVRYIFTMRTPLIDNRILLETENQDDYELDDCGNKISENSANSSFIYGAQDIPKNINFQIMNLLSISILIIIILFSNYLYKIK